MDVNMVVKGILDAHGGLDHWRSLSTIDVEMSAWGLLFRAKHVTPLRHCHLTISTQSPEVVLHDFPSRGLRAILHGTHSVEIRDASGRVLSSRANPREAFRRPRRLVYWDAMDFAYFCGYAMWGYLTLPFLLLYPGVQFDITKIGLAEGGRAGGGTRLEVRFPPDLPVHSATQQLYFDEAGRLYRHDYTAEVVGGWAKAAHLCRDYRQFGGLWLPTTRRVYPRGPFGRPLPGPTLVAVDIHDAQPRPA
jgi:hypothetical protein